MLTPDAPRTVPETTGITSELLIFTQEPTGLSKVISKQAGTNKNYLKTTQNHPELSQNQPQSHQNYLLLPQNQLQLPTAISEPFWN